MSQTDEEETSEFGSYIIDQESFSSDHSVLASKLALLAASGHSSSGEGISDDQISVDAETQARLEALLEAAGIGKLSTTDGKAFADPEVLRRLSSSVSCALDEAAAALSKMKTETENSNEHNQERSLVEACNDGDVNTVRRLLFEGHNANETTEDGESLLSLACSAGYYELAEMLLAASYIDNYNLSTCDATENLRRILNSDFLTLNRQLTKVLLTMHANVEDCGAKGECTPLMEAASGGYAEIVRLLLHHGADVNARSNTGNTALTYACCGGYEDVVRILVESGAELECHNENGHTPLMEAASGGHVQVAAILLQHGAGINTHSNEFKESALTLACYKGHLQMVRFLLQAGADQEHKTDEMHTALMEASMDGHVEVARLLLDSGAQVNMPADSFESPLTLAACGGHVDLAELLIQRGAAIEEVNDEGYTPLMEAAREGHEEMVTLLLNEGAKVNTKTEETQETALTLACCGGFMECVEVLLKAGADLEAGCSTPIMEAAQEGHLELVDYLVKQGANVRAATSSGDTALSYACEHGHTKVAEYLLSSGAELEHETDGGRTPLMKAARGGHLCTVKLLVLKGACVNRATKNSEHTVLSLACVCGHLNVVEYLLYTGADPNVKLKDGSNLLLEASKGGHANVVNFLLDLPSYYGGNAIENSQVSSTSIEQSAPRVPTQALPMVVPPQEPDQAPALIATAGCDHYPASSLLQFSSHLEGKMPQDGEKVANQLQALYQKQLEYYQQQNPTADKTDSTFNTAALVTHLVQQGSLMTQTSGAEQLTPDAKSAVDKDVAITVESFLRSMASDAAGGKLRTAESIVEEAKGKLSELEQRIKEAIEKNAQLKSVELMQTDQLTKEKVEEIYKTREEQIHKKQKILEELQKVERELQLKTQQQLKEHYLGESGPSQRGKPDGEAVEKRELMPRYPPQMQPEELNIEDNAKHDILRPLSLDSELPVAYHMQEDLLTHFDPSMKLHNGASGSFPQPAASLNDPCHCNHPCPPQITHPPSEPMPAPTYVSTGGTVPFPSRGMDIESHTESNHDTPLTLAAAGGHDELVHLLLSKGANIEHRDKKGFTPLILSATAGHANVVTSLLDANADIEALSDRTKDTPLSLACSGGRLEAADILLQRGANKEHRNVSDYTPLSLAASGGFVSVVKLLLHHGAEINSRTGSKLGISPLMLAAMNGHYESVQLLLDMGADINAQIETNRNTALTLACFQGRHNVVSLLVDRKANVEHRAKTGLTPLMEAASGGYAEVGRVLLDKGADPNAPPVPSSRDTALTIAADKGHYRFCELVLSRSALVEVRNKKGNTPLWLACNGGHLDVVMLLVGKGADVNATDNRSVTPLMAAFRKGNVQVVRWLAKEVSQFPSDSECMRYIATVSDKELLKRTHQCMECIDHAKELQAQEANKFASELLEELDNEKSVVKDRKSRAAKRREKRRKKKQKPTDDDDDDDDEDYHENEKNQRRYSEEDRRLPDILSPVSRLSLMDSPVASTAGIPQTITATRSSASSSSKPSPPTANSPIHVYSPTVITEESRVAPLPTLPLVRPKSPEPRKKSGHALSMSHDGYSSTLSGSESSPRLLASRVRRTRISAAKTPAHSWGDAVPTSKPSPRVTSVTYSSTTRTIQAKRVLRRDEGWKEVTKKYNSTGGVKRIMVASNLISRVIGRGGCNINAIREVTGAHIDIDKLKKGAIERTVTIKGSIEAIQHAQDLITSLIKEEKTEQEIADFIARAQAQAAEMRAAQSRPPPQKPHLTVVAAPIPSKPAWTVPPSIVAHSARQSQQQTNTTSSFIKVGVWKPPAPVTSSTTSTAPAPNKWISVTSSTLTTSATPTVETVKKALFVSSEGQVSNSAITTVTFSSRQSDKPISKPVQPVAPMMAAKTTTAPATRILQSSYGPIGSGIPSRNQAQPIQRPNPALDPMSLDQNNVNQVHDMGMQAATTPLQNQAAPMMMRPGPNIGHQLNVMTSGQNLAAPAQNVPMSLSATPNHQGVMQNQAYRGSMASVQGTMSISAGGTPRSNVGVTPVRGVNFADGAGDGEGYGPAQSIRSPTYSPFSSSFTPSAGSSVLWNNASTPGRSVPSYKVQSSVPGEDPVEGEPARNVVDQSKAPGYRMNAKSPVVVDNTAAMGVSSSNQSNPEVTGSASPGSQQGSPSGAEGEAAAKPRPIGTERAHHRKTNPTLPMTTGVERAAGGIWSYDKLTPVQLGMEAIETTAKFSNWSASMSQARSEGIITTAASSKPQVTTTEIASSARTPIPDPQAQNPRMPVMNYQLYSQATPPVWYGQQNRMQTNTTRFSQPPTNTGRVAVTQPPIGTQVGANIVGVQQQQHSSLQPIGSHLGGAGHLRGNVNYHQSQMQRSMNTNPPHQQATQNRYQLPYYMQQHADVGWQQQQHSMYNAPSRPPAMHPYQQKEPQHANPMYGSVHAPYPNNNLNQNPVIQGYSNPPMGDMNPAYPMHPEPQAPYIRDGGPYYEGGNEFVVRNVVANNYSNPPAENNPNWDPSMCRPGYPSINGVPDGHQSMMRAHQGMEMEPQQNWKEW